MPAPTDYEEVRAVGRDATAEPAWSFYSAYCEQRADGRRKPALAALERFIGEAADWPFEARLRFVRWVVQQRGRVWDSGIVLPEPLMRAVVWPTLEAWGRT
jgi:hypothetical protein